MGEAWLERRPGSLERRWFLLHGLLRGFFWLIPFFIGALLWLFWFEVTITDPVPLGMLILGLLVLLLFVLWAVVYPRNWEVGIGPREVMVNRGILWTTRVFVSYDRVQQIDRVSTPLMSRLNLTEIVLNTAAGGVRIFALDPDDADLIELRVRENKPIIPLMRR